MLVRSLSSLTSCQSVCGAGALKLSSVHLPSRSPRFGFRIFFCPRYPILTQPAAECRKINYFTVLTLHSRRGSHSNSFVHSVTQSYKMSFNNILGSLSQEKNLSPYELSRLENFKAVKKVLKGTVLDVEESANYISPTKENIKPRQKRKSFKKSSNEVLFVRRSARIRHDTKNSKKYKDTSDSDNDKNERPTRASRKGTFFVKFPWARNSENKVKDEEFYKTVNDSDFFTDDEIDYYEVSPKRRRMSHSAPVQSLPVSQITPEMIENVHYSSCGKKYSERGTTCHQCRQKTLDQKSYCRHKGCRGSRGMFCGFCLGKRYGEDVAEVLKVKKWACPPCRGYCNCSICRRREGKPPTGQLASVAESQGYKSVRHLLVDMEGENNVAVNSDEAKEEASSGSEEDSVPNHIDLDNTSDRNSGHISSDSMDDIFFEPHV